MLIFLETSNDHRFPWKISNLGFLFLKIFFSHACPVLKQRSYCSSGATHCQLSKAYSGISLKDALDIVFKIRFQFIDSPTLDFFLDIFFDLVACFVFLSAIGFDLEPVLVLGTSVIAFPIFDIINAFYLTSKKFEGKTMSPLS